VRSSTRIDIIDTETQEVVNSISGLSSSIGTLISSDGSKVYVLEFSDGISVYPTGSITPTVSNMPVGGSHYTFAFSADGDYIYIANRLTPGKVTQFRTSDNTISGTTTLSISFPESLGVLPNNSGVYVFSSSGLSIIDPAPATTEIATGILGGNRAVVVTSDSSRLIAANASASSVQVYDASSLATTPLSSPAISNPRIMQFTPDEQYALIGNEDDPSTFMRLTGPGFDAGSASSIILSGDRVGGIAVTSDNQTAYITHFGGNVSVVDIETMVETQLITLPGVLREIATKPAAAPTPTPTPADIEVAADTTQGEEIVGQNLQVISDQNTVAIEEVQNTGILSPTVGTYPDTQSIYIIDNITPYTIGPPIPPFWCN